MGSRANYVVVENGAWSLHSSHWGASRLATDLAFGPEAATRCFRANNRLDDAVRTSADAWLGDVWCEGAALVDHDRRLLLWFTDIGSEWDEHAAQQAVLARTWPGWEVRWAGDGLGDLLAHLGVGRDLLRQPRSTEVGEPGWLRPDDEDIVTLLTARGPNGEIRAWGSYWHVVEQLHGGRGLLDLLPLDAPAPVLEGMPEGGIHLDTGSRTLGVWTTAIAIGLHEWPLPGWDGWSLEF